MSSIDEGNSIPTLSCGLRWQPGRVPPEPSPRDRRPRCQWRGQIVKFNLSSRGDDHCTLDRVFKFPNIPGQS